jgi:hypothetical protein
VHIDLECTQAIDVCAQRLCLTCHTSCGLNFPFVLHKKIRKAGQISVPFTAFVLYSTMKKKETFSQASIGNKSVKKSRNESDLENSATLVTLFIFAP